MYRGLIHKYRDYLPIDDKHIVTLFEGNTPLLPCRNLPRHLGLNCKVYLKFEGLNPTGSFKDRGMTYAVSKAVEAGSKKLICASTGNTSAAAAAYAARSGLKAYVLIPEGKIAYGKLAQAIQYGAHVLQIQGNFDDALNAVREIGKNDSVTVVNSINPNRLPGQMTASYETIEALGEAPDYHFIPVGNAANIWAYWLGYKQYKQDGKSQNLPKMMGYQAAGAAPIVDGHVVKNPETIATAIRIGNPARWKEAKETCDESHGKIDKVTDDEIFEAYQLLAKFEGYFAEPAGAVSLAGLIKFSKTVNLSKDTRVVCTLTGHGLKDPDIAIQRAVKPQVCSADVKEIVKKIGF